MDTRKDAKERWEEAYSKGPERDAEFSTMSGVPIKPLYTPDDAEGEYDDKLGYPGEYPVHPRRLSEHVSWRLVDRHASSRVTVRPPRPTSGSGTYWITARTASPSPSICPP